MLLENINSFQFPCVVTDEFSRTVKVSPALKVAIATFSTITTLPVDPMRCCINRHEPTIAVAVAVESKFLLSLHCHSNWLFELFLLQEKRKRLIADSKRIDFITNFFLL